MKNDYTVFQHYIEKWKTHGFVVRIDINAENEDLYALNEFAKITKGYLTQEFGYNDFVFRSQGEAEIFCGAIVFYFFDLKPNLNQEDGTIEIVKRNLKFGIMGLPDKTIIKSAKRSKLSPQEPHTIIVVIEHNHSFYLSSLEVDYTVFKEECEGIVFNWIENNIPWYFRVSQNESIKILEIRYDLNSNSEDYSTRLYSLIHQYKKATPILKYSQLDLSNEIYNAIKAGISEQEHEWIHIYMVSLRTVNRLINQDQIYDLICEIVKSKILLENPTRFEILERLDLSEEKKSIILILKYFILYINRNIELKFCSISYKWWYKYLIGRIYDEIQYKLFLTYSDTERIIKELDNSFNQTMINPLKINIPDTKKSLKNRIKIAFTAVINHYGLDILGKISFVNILDDLNVFRENKDLKIIMKYAIEQGYFNKFLKIKEINGDVNHLIYNFSKATGFKKNRVNLIFEALSYGICEKDSSFNVKELEMIQNYNPQNIWSKNMDEDSLDEFFLSRTEYDNSYDDILGVEIANIGFSLDYFENLVLTCEIRRTKKIDRWLSLKYGVFNLKGRGKETGQIGYFPNKEIGTKIESVTFRDIKPGNIGRIKLYWD